jgi:hypothetical protein
VRPASKALVLSGAALGVLILARCSFGIDPDHGHFSCVNVADCASGQDCIPQADGGNGLCYLQGQCVPETCNGKDDDCDGVVDNHEPCGGGATCVDAGCVDCTGCADAVCAGASCVLDGGSAVCVPQLQADGGPGYVCGVPP